MKPQTFPSQDKQGHGIHVACLIFFLFLLLFGGWSVARGTEPDLSNTHELAKLVASTYNDHLGAGYGGHEHMDIKTKLLAVKFHKDTPAELVKALEDEKTLQALTWHLSMDGHRLVAHLVPRAPITAGVVPPLP